MIIGETIISDDWIEGHGPGESYWYKSCIKNAETKYILIYQKSYSKWILEFVNGSCRTNFPYNEYYLMFGDMAKFEFDSLKETQDHIDSFIIKLNNLKAFL